MSTIDSLEFVNRGAELAYLKACLDKADRRPALAFVRSPSGFGKSTLTDQLPSLSSLTSRSFCIVDPNIRGRVGAVSLHNGYFLQSLAQTLNEMARTSDRLVSTFSAFLLSQRINSAKSKDPTDALSEMPGLKSAYKVAFDYVARAFSFGKYSPEKLLKSDEAYAIAACTAYAQETLNDHVFVLVVREAQHIDLHSLKSLLEWSERHPGPDLIFEYTTDTGSFEPEHQKLILKFAQRRNGMKILDLVRLGADHLEFLIRNNVQDDFELTSDFYLSWDGNLRSIVELKFQVGIGRSLTDDRQIVRALTDLTDTVVEHVSTIAPLQKMILALVLSHVEAIDRTTLLAVMSAIEPHSQQTVVMKALDELENKHSFIGHLGGLYSIRNDTIANALHEIQPMQGLVALAERALKDHYQRTLEGDVGSMGLADSVRQYFRLCARTKDASALIEATEVLNDIIRRSQDQSIYVDVVASAIEADQDLYRSDHDALVEWAAGLAYESSDWQRANNLLSLIPNPSPFSIVLRACSLQEFGGHDETLHLLDYLRKTTLEPQALLAADLVEALVLGCRGETEHARKKLRAIIADQTYQESPLLGFAYRFFEIVEKRSESLVGLKASIDWFTNHSMPKSKAYSLLPAAMLSARFGDMSEARKLAQEAVDTLSGEVHDQHIVFNNLSAIELLSDDPDFLACTNQLNSALRFARDDFSEITILSNLGIAYSELGDSRAAEDCAERCSSILENPDFVDTDIFWPVCLNMSEIFRASGELAKCEASLSFAKEKAVARSDSKEYWKFRYGLIETPPEEYAFLLKNHGILSI